MGYRVKQFPPRNGWYVVLDVPAWAMEAMGCSNVIKKKLGDTKSEATAKAVQFVAKEQQKWEVRADRREVNVQEIFRDSQSAVEEMTDPTGDGGSPSAEEEFLHRLQGSGLSPDKLAQIELILNEGSIRGGALAALSDTIDEATGHGRPKGGQTWEKWIERRERTEEGATSTSAKWRTVLSWVSDWYGSNHLGTMTRKDAARFNEHMATHKRRGPGGLKPAARENYIGALASCWGWAVEVEEVEENIWSGLRKRIPKSAPKEPLSEELVIASQATAEQFEGLRYWFGRYQGLRREDYNGLRWCDVDLKERVIHLQQISLTRTQVVVTRHWRSVSSRKRARTCGYCSRTQRTTGGCRYGDSSDRRVESERCRCTQSSPPRSRS